MSRTGITAYISRQIITIARTQALRVVIVLMAGTALLSAFMSNTAITLLIAPIVLQAALVSDIPPYPLLMMAAIGASAAFLTPISSTTNLMVLTPGGYRFNDEVKVGFPLMVLFLLVSPVIVPLVYPV